MEERKLTIPFPDGTFIDLVFVRAEGDIHWTCNATTEFLTDAQALINSETIINS